MEYTRALCTELRLRKTPTGYPSLTSSTQGRTGWFHLYKNLSRQKARRNTVSSHGETLKTSLKSMIGLMLIPSTASWNSLPSQKPNRSVLPVLLVVGVTILIRLLSFPLIKVIVNELHVFAAYLNGTTIYWLCVF